MAKKKSVSNLIMNIGFVLVLLFEACLLTIVIPLLLKKNAPEETVIVSGDANVELHYYTDDGEYVELPDGALFGGEWSPSTTQVVYLEIKNVSEYRIQCMVALSAKMKELNGAFEYAAIENAHAEDKALAWDDFKTDSVVRPLTDGMNALNGTEYFYVEPQSSAYVAFAVHMREEAGNEYQNKSCALGVTLIAAQVEEQS